MSTATIYTTDPQSQEKAWTLNVGTVYLFKTDGYGIVVIEDALRMKGSMELGTFPDRALTLNASIGGWEIESVPQAAHTATDAMSVYLEPVVMRSGQVKVRLIVPPNAK